MSASANGADDGGPGRTPDAVDPQREVIDYLTAPGCPAFLLSQRRERPSRYAARVLDTHSAHLFIGERSVCKIKRIVRYSYLDTTSLATRRRLCERELELNRAVLPDIYVDVVAVTREADASLAIDGAGVPLEWVLRMHRFDERDVLDTLAREHRLTHALATRLGRSLARYHAALPSVIVEDGEARVAEVIDELAREFDALAPILVPPATKRFADVARSALERHRELVGRRGRDGFVRRCHGDLHLRNILLHDGEPVPFDALEFDERLATTDVLYDLAFLLMDLGHRDLRAQQGLVLNAWLLESDPTNLAGLALLPLFVAVRAAVRAMTSAQAARADGTGAATLASEAASYLQMALDTLAPRHPMLLALGGLSGSGKSTAARALACGVARSPGAVLLASDAERKRALDIAPTERLPSELYTPEAAAENYARLLAKARHALVAGFAVIVDATFLGEHDAAPFERLASELGVPFLGLWLDAPEHVLRRRITGRVGDVSDATLGVLERQLASGATPPEGWHRVDAGGDAGATLAGCTRTIRHGRDTRRLLDQVHSLG